MNTWTSSSRHVGQEHVVRNLTVSSEAGAGLDCLAEDEAVLAKGPVFCEGVRRCHTHCEAQNCGRNIS